MRKGMCVMERYNRRGENMKGSRSTSKGELAGMCAWKRGEKISKTGRK